MDTVRLPIRIVSLIMLATPICGRASETATGPASTPNEHSTIAATANSAQDQRKRKRRTANAGKKKPAKPAGRPNRSAEPDQFHLLTAWGEKVSTQNAWREYPRPDMRRDQWLCLNGLWDFSIVGNGARWTAGRIENAKFDPLLGGPPTPPTAWQHRILVPFSPETQLSGVAKSVRPSQVLWYRRSFEVPKTWAGQRVLLHFDAVDWHAIVLVNGTQVGDHKGGYIPFVCDITDALQGSGQQELRVVAWDPTNMGDQPVGKQALPELRRGFRYTPNSGIWQSVWLEPVPAAAHIGGVKITPVAFQRAFDLNVKVAGDATRLTIRAVAERDATEITGRPGDNLRFNVSDKYTLWSPDNPVLHNLRIELRSGDRLIDTVRTYFALRTIDVARDGAHWNRIRLNGKPIFQFGPLDQGYWPGGALTPPSEAAVRGDLKYLKDIGCNMVRVHIKVHPRRWYYEADRLGLLVWQDFVCSRKFDPNITPASAAQWELEQRRMLDLLHNHPSIVMWIVFNEGWGQYDTERLTKWAKAHDPSRLVNPASGWTNYDVGDVYDNHDYSFNASPAHGANFTRRASLCGECGGFNVLVRGHLWHPDQTQATRVTPNGETGRESYASVDQWEHRYRPWLTNLRLLQSSGLNAAVYTQISDVEHECNGWLTYDRNVSKITVARLARWHATLYQPLHTHTLVDLANGKFVHRVGRQTPGWEQADFDARSWAHVKTGTKSVLRPAVVAPVGTGPIQLRTSVRMQNRPTRLALHTVGAGKWDIFFNGQLVMTITNSDRAGYVPYCTILLPSMAVEKLRNGDNTVAARLTSANDQPAELFDFALRTLDAEGDQ